MTTVHDEFLELAAAAIDFPLSGAEQTALDVHLATCTDCRRRVAGFAFDQRSIAGLPRYALTPAAAEQVRGHVTRRGTSTRPTLRLLAVAAILALLALAALTVGAQLLQRDRDRDLTQVPISSAEPSPGTPKVGPAIFAAGSTLEVVVSGLRVRTEPTVDDSKSAKLEPLLGLGVQLQVLDGPVTADDYDWYLVQAVGWPHRGWVAAADHDGEAWIEDRSRASSPPATFTAVEAALVAGLRDDAAIDCAPRRAGLPPRAIAGVECRVNGAVVTRVGAYHFGDARDAATTYLERLASFDVKPATGDCAGGTSGDAAWMTGDGKAGKDSSRVYVGDTGPWVVGRMGCYLDANGTANVRLTCGTTYVGILGRDSDLADLDRWAVASANGPTTAGQMPGICRGGS
jgi:hypothetical protein